MVGLLGGLVIDLRAGMGPFCIVKLTLECPIRSLATLMAAFNVAIGDLIAESRPA